MLTKGEFLSGFIGILVLLLLLGIFNIFLGKQLSDLEEKVDKINKADTVYIEKFRSNK